MQSEKTLLDDLARFATGAAGALGDVKTEFEARLRELIERLLARMDLPTREEVAAAKALAAAARAKAEELEARLDALEGRGAPAKSAARPAAKGRRPRSKAT